MILRVIYLYICFFFSQSAQYTRLMRSKNFIDRYERIGINAIDRENNFSNLLDCRHFLFGLLFSCDHALHVSDRVSTVHFPQLSVAFHLVASAADKPPNLMDVRRFTSVRYIHTDCPFSLLNGRNKKNCSITTE